MPMCTKYFPERKLEIHCLLIQISHIYCPDQEIEHVLDALKNMWCYETMKVSLTQPITLVLTSVNESSIDNVLYALDAQRSS
jgi:hypothetical protein